MNKLLSQHKNARRRNFGIYEASDHFRIVTNSGPKINTRTQKRAEVEKLKKNFPSMRTKSIKISRQTTAPDRVSPKLERRRGNVRLLENFRLQKSRLSAVIDLK